MRLSLGENRFCPTIFLFSHQALHWVDYIALSRGKNWQKGWAVNKHSHRQQKNWTFFIGSKQVIQGWVASTIEHSRKGNFIQSNTNEVKNLVIENISVKNNHKSSNQSRSTLVSQEKQDGVIHAETPRKCFSLEPGNYKNILNISFVWAFKPLLAQLLSPKPWPKQSIVHFIL